MHSAWGHPHGASRALPQPFQLALEINPKPRCWWAALEELGAGLRSLCSRLSHREREKKPSPDPPRPSHPTVPSLGERGPFSPSVPCPSPPKAHREMSGTSTPLLSPILLAHPKGCQHLPSALVQTHKNPKTFLSLLLPLPLFLSLILNSRLRSA